MIYFKYFCEFLNIEKCNQYNFTNYIFFQKLKLIINRIFFISHYFGIGSDSFYFLRLKFSLFDINAKIMRNEKNSMNFGSI